MSIKTFLLACALCAVLLSASTASASLILTETLVDEDVVVHRSVNFPLPEGDDRVLHVTTAMYPPYSQGSPSYLVYANGMPFASLPMFPPYHEIPLPTGACDVSFVTPTWLQFDEFGVPTEVRLPFILDAVVVEYTVPEPATLALAGIGALALIRRRRAQN